jgi:hypothetical protein
MTKDKPEVTIRCARLGWMRALEGKRETLGQTRYHFIPKKGLSKSQDCARNEISGLLGIVDANESE